MLEELVRFAIVLDEFDDLGIQTGELAVMLVFSGIVDGPAVEHITAAVAGRIYRDSFLVSETGDAHLQPFVLGHIVQLPERGQFRQHFVQVGIIRERRFEELAQVAQRIGHTGQKMRLFLKETAETVGTQDLDGAEQNEETQAGTEFFFIHLGIALQGPQIGFHQFVAQVFRETGTGLPDKRGHIIIDGTAAATLEINEIGLSILHHHVAGLEVPVHEGFAHVAHEVVPQAFEILL